jgi:hypothetical protein
MALLQGSGIDAEAALLRLGRLEGRVGGSGPAGSLEDLKRVWSVPLPATSVLFFAGLLILQPICLLSATRRTAAPSTSFPKGCWLLTALLTTDAPFPPRFVPNATDSLLLDHLSTGTPDPSDLDAYDQFGFDADGQWVWTSGTVPRIETFDEASSGGDWLPTKAECETHVCPG